MVVDQLGNAYLYESLGPRICRALDYARKTDLAGVEPGTYELEGRSVYALVQEYTSKPPEQGKWEAHRHYIDLQVVVQGTERIGYGASARMMQGTYDPDKDFLTLSGDGSFVTMHAGDFMLLWPGDAHMPGMAVDAPSAVKKLVVKISVD